MLNILYLIYVCLVAAPLLLVATLLTALTTIIGCRVGDGNFWGYYPGKIWSRVVCFLLLIPVSTQGHQLIDKNTSYVFVANHQGAFDIFLIYGYLGHNFKWVMKKGIRTIPFVGRACEAAHHIFVDKSGPKAIRESLLQAEKTLQGGMSLVVFPEGERTLTGHLNPFKKGAYQLAIDLSLPVVPLVIEGSYKILKRNTANLHYGRLKLTILPPIFPDDTQGHSQEELIAHSYRAIADALGE